MPNELQQELETLQGNIKRMLDLEDDIKEGKQAAKGVAELKEKVASMSMDNANTVDTIKELAAEAMKQQAKENGGEVFASIHERIDEFETKMKERGVGRQRKATPGAAFVKAIKDKDLSTAGARYKHVFDGTTMGDFDRAVKQITNLADSAGDLLIPDFDETIIEQQRRMPRVRDLLTTLRTDRDVITDFREVTDGDKNFAPDYQSAQGDVKSESDREFTTDQWTVETIAHHLTTSVQILDDVTRLQDFINRIMLLELDLKVEDEIIYGPGTAGTFRGLIPESEAFDTDLVTDLDIQNTTDIDRLRAMILQLAENNFPATGMLMSPFRWAKLELKKDTQDRYLFASPQNAAGPRLWGLPVVATNAVDRNDLHVGNYQLGAVFYDRQNPSLTSSTEHADNYTRNLVTFRAEMRGAVQVRRSSALIYFDATPAA